ncbi:MAG: integral membrane protein [Acidimicrobiales bacterium]
MTRSLASVLPPLRRISIVEAVSYLVLLIATVVKRIGTTELGVTIVGPIHGVLFLVYAAMLLRDYNVLGWTLWKTVAAMVIGSLPLGGFWVERKWLATLA